MKTPGGQRPHSVAVDPTGKRVAVGYDDTRTVEIFDARTLERIAVADNSDIENGNLLAVVLVVGRQVRPRRRALSAVHRWRSGSIRCGFGMPTAGR